MAELTCILCKHWWFNGGEPYYSDLTPGENWTSRCKKGMWEAHGANEYEGTYRKKLLIAQICNKFEHYRSEE